MIPRKRKAAKPVQRNESDKQSRAWWQAIDRAAATAPRLVDKPKRKRKVAKPVCKRCHGAGKYLMNADCHRSAGLVPCDCLMNTVLIPKRKTRKRRAGK